MGSSIGTIIQQYCYWNDLSIRPPPALPLSQILLLWRIWKKNRKLNTPLPFFWNASLRLIAMEHNGVRINRLMFYWSRYCAYPVPIIQQIRLCSSSCLWIIKQNSTWLKILRNFQASSQDLVFQHTATNIHT